MKIFNRNNLEGSGVGRGKGRLNKALIDDILDRNGDQ